MSEIKSLEVVPFKAQHLQCLDLLPDEFVTLEDIKPEGGGGLIENGGPAFSAFDGDKLIFCFGIARTAEGQGEAWSVCDKCVTKYLRELLCYCRSYLDRAFKEGGFVEIYAHTKTDWKKSANFDRLLGFKKVDTSIGPNGLEYYVWRRTR